MLVFFRHAFHMAFVGFVLVREGVFALIPRQDLPAFLRSFLVFIDFFARKEVKEQAKKGRGDRIVAALTRLGPSYVKLGQFLATRPDIIGFTLAQDLEALQDQMPPFSQQEAIATIEHALGQPITQLFEDFSPPIAAASIAQVHHAVYHENGERREVAVKVLRPGIVGIFKRDMAAQKYFAHLLTVFVPDTRRLKPVEVIETLERSLRMEMDLRFEAAALAEMAENTQTDSDFHVPKVDWERTSQTCLTLAWVNGIKINDLNALDQAGIDRKRLARIAMQSFLRHALWFGFFHADMHPGNLFAARDGSLIAVDLGITGRLQPKERRFLAEILYGFITRNYKRVAEVHFEAGYVPSTHRLEDFAQALRAVGEKIHGRSSSQISMADLLGLLFEITALFDMQTRLELVFLQKNMVVVEGVARKLDPDFDLWRTAEPILREWIERHMGPVGRLEAFARDTSELAASLSRLPALLEAHWSQENRHNQRPPAFLRLGWLERGTLWALLTALIYLIYLLHKG